VDIALDAYSSEPLVDEGYLILKDEQILACFKPVLDQLMEMVESQIAEIKRKGGAAIACVSKPISLGSVPYASST
jgi:hypothetical protein